MPLGRLVAACHYLPFHGLFGRALRPVASSPDGRWLALLGWKAGALRVAVRDRWIGWSPQQKLRRLHLVVLNARFVILPAGQGCPNLASRVLGLCLRHQSPVEWGAVLGLDYCPEVKTLRLPGGTSTGRLRTHPSARPSHCPDSTPEADAAQHCQAKAS